MASYTDREAAFVDCILNAHPPPLPEVRLLKDVTAERAAHDATRIAKLPLQHLPWEALEEVARVIQDGAKKYEMNNWRKGAPYMEFIGSAFRHLVAFVRGSDKDPDSGLHPLAHCVCDCLFIITWCLQGKGTDDRVKTVKE